MKKLFLLVLFLFIYSCAGNKTVFWCGDHACINKKEKETYFKKTMTVEIKKIGNKNKENYSSHEKILQQVKTDTKKRVKEERELSKELDLEEKMRIKREKKLAKQLKTEEKMRIKRERKLAKQLKLEKKKKIKVEKKLKSEVKNKPNKEKKLVKEIKLANDENISSSIFAELREKIVQKNLLRPYPDINDIKN